MPTVKVVLAHHFGHSLTVLRLSGHQVVVEVELPNSENGLELLRTHFRAQFDASVHCLRWIFPEYALLPSSTPGPVLVLHVDVSGNLPLAGMIEEPGSANRCGNSNQRSRLVIEASRTCSSQPWSASGWFDRMREWAELSLADDVRAVSQISLSDCGAVLRIDARRHTYFLKTLPSFLAAEVALVRLLHAKLPRSVPAILSTSPDPNTHVSQGIEGMSLLRLDDVDSWRRSLEAIASLQLASVDKLREMRGAGVFHQSLAHVAAHLERSIGESITMQEGLKNELAIEERRKIPHLIERAIRDCDALDACHLPDTIVNTDMNESNIFITEHGETTFIDWTFARISHPFLTLDGPLFVLGKTSHRMRFAYDSLRDAYLMQWREYCGLGQLLQGLECAQRLLSLLIALDLARYMPALKEDEPGHVLSLPRQLRVALAAYAE